MSLLTQSSSVPWRRVGDDILLAPACRDDFDHLSGTAAVVWRLLETPRSMASLVDELTEMYAAPTQGIDPDVQALVADLIKRGAIEELEEAHG